MASLHKGQSGIYNVSFRWQGRQFLKSTKTSSKRDALTVLGRVDDTIKMLRVGRIPNPTPPQGVDIGDYILSGCTLAAKVDTITLKDACDGYKADSINKAPNTKRGEALHLRNFCRILKDNTKLDRIDFKTLKKYANERMSKTTPGKGRTYKPASGLTVHKELLTFTQLWEWGRKEGHVLGGCPVKDPTNNRKWAIKLPKTSEAEPFSTWAEIENRIKQEKLDNKQAAKLWRRVYLDETQLSELLSYTKSKADMGRYPFMYTVMLLVAYTGIRRSEMMNVLVSDVHIDNDVLIVREKKRDKSKSQTTRTIPLMPTLKNHLVEIIKGRNGGGYLIVDKNGEPLTEHNVVHYFDRILAKSKWSVIHGYHTLRHSFASICLRKGIPAHVIAKWMGHTTQQMIALYQKTYIQDEKEYIKQLGK